MELVHYSRLQTYLPFWKIVYEAWCSRKVQVSDRQNVTCFVEGLRPC